MMLLLSLQKAWYIVRQGKKLGFILFMIVLLKALVMCLLTLIL